jgi:hypothetical protein
MDSVYRSERRVHASSDVLKVAAVELLELYNSLRLKNSMRTSEYLGMCSSGVLRKNVPPQQHIWRRRRTG